MKKAQKKRALKQKVESEPEGKKGKKDKAKKKEKAEEEAVEVSRWRRRSHRRSGRRWPRQGVTQAGMQKAGCPFVPADWAEKYKPVLGPYKQFLKEHAEDFVLVTEKNGDFIIRLRDQLDPPSIPNKKDWEKQLLKAWMGYCQAVPREERDFRGSFLAALPKAALATAHSGSPKVSPQSPILSPKSPGLSFAEPSLPKGILKKGKRTAGAKGTKKAKT
ncbi:unnamed protein product [Durusdinium trenchii]|uniref:Uncharacterized protein n=1 Tax=Durusdinium trenchii TaxID=1381693 RepID=A0ABP0MJ19_9DINO